MGVGAKIMGCSQARKKGRREGLIVNVRKILTWF